MSSNNEENQTDKKEIDELEEDYYAILNLSKDAPEKDITQAYHRFGRIYHPDKHKTPESKKNAEMLFSKIKRVYDVLSDPHKRAIYDNVGVKGLRQDGWQIITRTKTPKEIREEYERLANEKAEKRLRELTNTLGEVSIGVNATSIFDRYGDIDEMLNIEISEFSMSQQVDIALTDTDSSTISFGMGSTSGRRTAGSLTASFRRIMSPNTWLQFSSSFGVGKGIELKGFRRLTDKCSGTLSGMFSFQNGGIVPTFVPTVSYNLTKNLNGHIIYKSGAKSRMKTIVEYNLENNIQLVAACQLSVSNTFISFEVNKKFLTRDISLRSSIKYGYLGFVFNYGITKKITEFSHLNASILIGDKIGVCLNIRVDRASQSFSFPIQLSEEILPSAIFYGSFVPIALYFVVNKFIIEPYVKDKESKDNKEKKENLRTELIEKRRQALVAQELMNEAYMRSLDREGSNGLIILNAFYGKLPQQMEEINNETENLINVFIPLQVLIKDHSLQILTDSSKSDLQGFYDPCIGEAKSLFIKYKFNDELHQATFDDNDIIRIPKKSHRILQ